MDAPETFEQLKARADLVVEQIEVQDYYLDLWHRVEPEYRAAKTKHELLRPFQKLWELLPDSRHIRRPPFFAICNLAEQYCFGE